MNGATTVYQVMTVKGYPMPEIGFNPTWASSISCVKRCAPSAKMNV